MLGNAGGGKPGSYGSKAILLSHMQWVEPSPQSLSLDTPASAAEQWRGWPITHLLHSSTEQDPSQGGPLYVPDAPNNSEGPQAREPLSA